MLHTGKGYYEHHQKSCHGGLRLPWPIVVSLIRQGLCYVYIVTPVISVIFTLAALVMHVTLLQILTVSLVVLSL